MTGCILTMLEEYVYLLQREGVWAILDIGATRCVGGEGPVEELQLAMSEVGCEDIEVLDEVPSFTFGNGESKSALNTILINMHLTPAQKRVKMSVLAARVPILLGMDLLRTECNAVIDCGRGLLCLPSICPTFYYCEPLSGGHLAVNLTNPEWWRSVPASLLWQDAGVSDEAPAAPE